MCSFVDFVEVGSMRLIAVEYRVLRGFRQDGGKPIATWFTQTHLDVVRSVLHSTILKDVQIESDLQRKASRQEPLVIGPPEVIVGDLYNARTFHRQMVVMSICMQEATLDVQSSSSPSCLRLYRALSRRSHFSDATESVCSYFKSVKPKKEPLLEGEALQSNQEFEDSSRKRYRSLRPKESYGLNLERNVSSQHEDASHDVSAAQCNSRSCNIENETPIPSRHIRDLSVDGIEELLYSNRKYLKDIFIGKIPCRRSSDYNRGGHARISLCYQVNVAPFTSEQVEKVMAVLRKFMKNDPFKFLDFILKVMLPEALTKIFMDFVGVSRETAEKMMDKIAKDAVEL